ncbi:DUF2461 family protein [Mycobacterium sp.]|uniref:DUF2461 family protein n=1 Tax=Mycobacterium sp. TaxID=1785 RepID=UPI002D10B336|nr:DUF2461 family protein [Mycobacterium sp.]HME46599.1 DUF2461 family protein [Mycobacterium sp.]
MTSAFFGQGAVRFLKAVTANNTKAFFDAHRADYEREILTPLRELGPEAPPPPPDPRIPPRVLSKE